MPYIKQEDRGTARVMPRTAGELNYAISMLIDGYVSTKGLNYQTIADINAAATGARDEFNRRFGHPYEDLKIEDNGEVFDTSKQLLLLAQAEHGRADGP